MVEEGPICSSVHSKTLGAYQGVKLNQSACGDPGEERAEDTVVVPDT